MLKRSKITKLNNNLDGSGDVIGSLRIESDFEMRLRRDLEYKKNKDEALLNPDRYLSGSAPKNNNQMMCTQRTRQIERKTIYKVMNEPALKSGKKEDSMLFYFAVLYAHASIKSVEVYHSVPQVKYCDISVSQGELLVSDDSLGRKNVADCVVNLKDAYGLRNRTDVKVILDQLKEMGFIRYSCLGKSRSTKGMLYKVKIKNKEKFFSKHASYAQPYPKIGYVLLPTEELLKLLKPSTKTRLSKADAFLDLWTHTYTTDPSIAGSMAVPVTAFAWEKSGVSDPRFQLQDIADRWGMSKSAARRLLVKFADAGLISYYTWENRTERNGYLVVPHDFCKTAFETEMDPYMRTPYSMSLTIDAAVFRVKNMDELVSDEYFSYNAENAVYHGNRKELHDLDPFFGDIDRIGSIQTKKVLKEEYDKMTVGVKNSYEKILAITEYNPVYIEKQVAAETEEPETTAAATMPASAFAAVWEKVLSALSIFAPADWENLLLPNTRVCFCSGAPPGAG